MNAASFIDGGGLDGTTDRNYSKSKAASFIDDGGLDETTDRNYSKSSFKETHITTTGRVVCCRQRELQHSVGLCWC